MPVGLLGCLFSWYTSEIHSQGYTWFSWWDLRAVDSWLVLISSPPTCCRMFVRSAWCGCTWSLWGIADLWFVVMPWFFSINLLLYHLLLILYFSPVLLNSIQLVFSLTLLCLVHFVFFFPCFAFFLSKNISYIAWKYMVLLYVRKEKHFMCHSYLSTDLDNCLSSLRLHEIAINHVEYSIRTVPISFCSLSE